MSPRIHSLRLFLFSLPLLLGSFSAHAETAPKTPDQTETKAAPADQSHGEPIHLYWKQEEIYDHNKQTVTLTGGARAVRGDVTLDADMLVGYLRDKAPSAKTEQDDKKNGNDLMGGNMELYRVEAIGHVHFYNQTSQGWGDHGIYDVDRAVILLTGKHMKFTTPHQIMTARDLVEYYPKERITIGRGDASVTNDEGKRVIADILKSVGLSDAQKAQQQKENGKSNGSLDRAYGWGHVVIKTDKQVATGDRGVYLFGPELARVIGHVHITQGQNQNNGSQAVVNMKTGIATMLPGHDSPIQGLVVPNEANQ
ncbi:LptA/OstA family protein [Acetobacteraceae bacterium ESL0709]|nr:LptA/OstA family protein [Acetobacteraceae bacterium ESL0697]MDF7677769.1 LptA/OstA family protein [Acetobacteraceae bacterium ESL0709]